jgi:hypothetical protein
MIAPPPPAAIIRLAASWATINTPFRLVSIIWSQLASLILSALLASAIPALLATTVTVPMPASARSKASIIEAALVTSIGTAIASPPEALISATSDARRSIRRAATTTFAPRAERIFAKCTPNPLDAPVTMAILPVISNSVFIFPLNVYCLLGQSWLAALVAEEFTVLGVRYLPKWRRIGHLNSLSLIRQGRSQSTQKRILTCREIAPWELDGWNIQVYKRIFIWSIFQPIDKSLSRLLIYLKLSGDVDNLFWWQPRDR